MAGFSPPFSEGQTVKLTENFTLEELVFSETASRLGLDNRPDQSEVENLTMLCRFVLEPLRAAAGGRAVTVTSGFRAHAVNKAAGGADGSDHEAGRAADIRIAGMRPIEVCRLVKSLGLPFKQCIHEFGSWCHVSIPIYNDPPKRECLTAVRVRGKKTAYLVGFTEV